MFCGRSCIVLAFVISRHAEDVITDVIPEVVIGVDVEVFFTICLSACHGASVESMEDISLYSCESGLSDFAILFISNHHEGDVNV